jgi:hypothetical protein
MHSPSISLREKACWLTSTVAVLYMGYQASNRFHWCDPFTLILTPVDRAIPFLLWTIWPYYLLIALLVLPLFLKDRGNFFLALIAYGIATGGNIIFWTVFPTCLPRLPLPEGTGLSLEVYRWLCLVDTPANCFPSGHITGPTVACWALARENPKWGLWVWLLFAILSLSILTTKQHYLIDLGGGLLSGAMGIIAAKQIARRWNQKQAQSIK